MLYIKPDYYDDFSCVADKCEDTCCAGWQIVIDQETFDRYRKEKGPFRKRLRKGICWHKKVFRQDRRKRCAFLNDENLCDLYLGLGEGGFCKTCNLYPRHIEEFEDVRETTLSISCPEVVKYLMHREEPVSLIYEETEEEENCRDFEAMNFDALLYDILAEGRKTMLSILQDRNISMKDRCERILHLAADMEALSEEEAIFSCYDLFEQYEENTEVFTRRRLRHSMEFSKRVTGNLFRLERLRDDWEALLSESASILYLDGEENYLTLSEDFAQWQKGEGFSLEIPLEQLVVYYLTTYFCGAAYDGNILSKVQAAVLWGYILYELFKARWVKNDRTFDREDLSEIVYRFSREIEHSDRNIIGLERLAKAALPVKRPG